MRIALAAAFCVLLLGVAVPAAVADSAAREAAAPPSVRLYTKRKPPRRPALAQLPKLAKVEKDGVTWTFASPAPIGRFITGDYYVVARSQ